MGDFAGGSDEERRLLSEADEDDSSGKDAKKNTSWLRYNLKLLIVALAVVALVVLGIVVGAVSNKHSQAKKLNRRLARNEFPYPGIRLPKNLEPLRYRIYLHPNLTTFNVSGSTRILIRCVIPTKKVILHFKGHTITDIRLLKGSYLNGPIGPRDILVENEHRVNAEKELIMVESPKELEAGENYTLIVRYSGTLSESLEGFYRSSYKTKNGEIRYESSVFCIFSSYHNNVIYNLKE